MSPGAFLALWNDIEARREPEYDTWHTREHVPERVSAPGFISGCRYLDPAHPVHRYFTLYEVESLAAFDTPEYRDLLANPTPWSASMRPSFRNVLRVPCRRMARAGHGRGAALAVLRFLASGDPLALLPALMEQPGLVAATLGRPAEGAAAMPWQAPLDSATAPFDTVLLLEALDLPAAQRGLDAARAALGILPGGPDRGGVYALASVFPGADAEERLAHRRSGWPPVA